MNSKNNAKYHLKHVCPYCPETRKLTRDMEGCGDCWWENNWKHNSHNIPRTFGLANYVRASFGLPTKLDKFKKL